MKKTGLRILKGLALATTVLVVLGGCDITLIFQDSPPPSQDDLTFTLTWNGDVDLDLYLTYPDPGSNSVTSGDVPVYSDIYVAYDAPPEGLVGFFPEDAAPDVDPASRESLYSGNRTSSDANGDATWTGSEGQEVITVVDIPFEHDTLVATDYNTPPSTNNGLSTTHDWYAWIGVMEVYVYAPTGSLDDANDILLEVRGYNDAFLGDYPIDESAELNGVSVVRIPVFKTETSGAENYYQVLLDKKIVRDTIDIRSISDSPYVFAGNIQGR